MPYAHPFMRLTLSGALYTTEAWAFGFTLGHVGTGNGTAPSEVPAGIISAAETFFHANYIGSHATLETIKYNMIGVDGLYVDQGNTVRHDEGTAITGTGSVTALPQAALVVSLRTALARGVGHAGRFYLPACGKDIASDGRLAEADCTAIAAAATTFLNAINAVDAQWRLAVVSKVGSGHEHYITNVRVGRVVDTMRSRRTSLAEAPITGATLASS